ncbi:MAG: hypothetical protein RSD44_08140, partial [Akkermansia sp.]
MSESGTKHKYEFFMSGEYPKNVSINKDSKSKFWFVSFIIQGGSRKRRSTKVPVNGGMFGSEKLSAKQAENRALIEGHKVAEKESQKKEEFNDISLRAFLSDYLERRKEYVSKTTHINQRSAFNKLCDFLGRRANESIRLVPRIDAKRFAKTRRKHGRRSLHTPYCPVDSEKVFLPTGYFTRKKLVYTVNLLANPLAGR